MLEIGQLWLSWIPVAYCKSFLTFFSFSPPFVFVSVRVVSEARGFSGGFDARNERERSFSVLSNVDTNLALFLIRRCTISSIEVRSPLKRDLADTSSSFNRRTNNVSSIRVGVAS